MKRLLVFIFLLSIGTASAQKALGFDDYASAGERKWVDSIYNGL